MAALVTSLTTVLMLAAPHLSLDLVMQQRALTPRRCLLVAFLLRALQLIGLAMCMAAGCDMSTRPLRMLLGVGAVVLGQCIAVAYLLRKICAGTRAPTPYHWILRLLHWIEECGARDPQVLAALLTVLGLSVLFAECLSIVSTATFWSLVFVVLALVENETRLAGSPTPGARGFGGGVRLPVDVQEGAVVLDLPEGGLGSRE